MLVGLATVILTVSNIHIYFIARRHAASILRNNSAAVNAKETKVIKATYVCLSAVLSFIILWLPLLIHNGMVLTQFYIPENNKMFTKIAFGTGSMNAIVDPIVYICFRKEVRKKLATLLRNI